MAHESSHSTSSSEGSPGKTFKQQASVHLQPRAGQRRTPTPVPAHLLHSYTARCPAQGMVLPTFRFPLHTDYGNQDNPPETCSLPNLIQAVPLSGSLCGCPNTQESLGQDPGVYGRNGRQAMAGVFFTAGVVTHTNSLVWGCGSVGRLFA